MNWHSVVETYIGIAVVSYAIKTAPVPNNPWARWLMGVIQFAALNWEKGQEHFGDQSK